MREVQWKDAFFYWGVESEFDGLGFDWEGLVFGGLELVVWIECCDWLV